MEVKTFEGVINRWLDERGFGFINAEGQNRDVFCHVRDFKFRGREPVEGDKVKFELGKDDQNRVKAINIHYTD